MLVYPGEIVGSDIYLNTYTSRYMVKISQTSEANLNAAINDIIDGIKKLNRRTAIAEYTRPSQLWSIQFIHANKAYENPLTKRWDVDVYIEVLWNTT